MIEIINGDKMIESGFMKLNVYQQNDKSGTRFMQCSEKYGLHNRSSAGCIRSHTQ